LLAVRTVADLPLRSRSALSDIDEHRLLRPLSELGPLLRNEAPERVIPVFLETLSLSFGWPVAEYWVRDEDRLRLRATHHVASPSLEALEAASSEYALPLHACFEDAPPDSATLWFENTAAVPEACRAPLLRDAGLQTLVIVPLPPRNAIESRLVLLDFAARPRTPAETCALSIAAEIFSHHLVAECLGQPGETASGPPLRTYQDAATRTLVGYRSRIQLTSYEWGLLSLLFAHEGEALSFEEISLRVWGVPEGHVSRAAVYEVVTRLRRHLAAVGAPDYRIRSIPRFGYMFEPAGN
jgi:hypothetical protein